MKKRRLHLYTAAMLFACTYSLHGQTTYTDGVFMLNEDWYGHNNSTLNFIRPDHPTDPFEYYIIQNNESNAGQSLGATAQFGAVYGDYLSSSPNRTRTRATGFRRANRQRPAKGAASWWPTHKPWKSKAVSPSSEPMKKECPSPTGAVSWA